MSRHVDEDGILFPETKALILAELIKVMAAIPGPALGTAVIKTVLQNLGLDEETIGAETAIGLFVLVQHGILTSSTYYAHPDYHEIDFSKEHTVAISKSVLHYLYSEP